ILSWWYNGTGRSRLKKVISFGHYNVMIHGRPGTPARLQSSLLVSAIAGARIVVSGTFAASGSDRAKLTEEAMIDGRPFRVRRAFWLFSIALVSVCLVHAAL